MLKWFARIQIFVACRCNLKGAQDFCKNLKMKTPALKYTDMHLKTTTDKNHELYTLRHNLESILSNINNT